MADDTAILPRLSASQWADTLVFTRDCRFWRLKAEKHTQHKPGTEGNAHSGSWAIKVVKRGGQDMGSSAEVVSSSSSSSSAMLLSMIQGGNGGAETEQDRIEREVEGHNDTTIDEAAREVAGQTTNADINGVLDGSSSVGEDALGNAGSAAAVHHDRVELTLQWFKVS